MAGRGRMCRVLGLRVFWFIEVRDFFGILQKGLLCSIVSRGILDSLSRVQTTRVKIIITTIKTPNLKP